MRNVLRLFERSPKVDESVLHQLPMLHLITCAEWKATNAKFFDQHGESSEPVCYRCIRLRYWNLLSRRIFLDTHNSALSRRDIRFNELRHMATCTVSFRAWADFFRFRCEVSEAGWKRLRLPNWDFGHGHAIFSASNSKFYSYMPPHLFTRRSTKIANCQERQQWRQFGNGWASGEAVVFEPKRDAAARRRLSTKLSQVSWAGARRGPERDKRGILFTKLEFSGSLELS
jgi:hypothetical protein